MDISNVPDKVWEMLAEKTIDAGGKNVKSTVDNYFYNHVYRRWTIDFQKIDYKSNMAGVKDVGWADLAKMWAKGRDHVLPAKDTTRGTLAMQTEDDDPTHKGTRMGESYTEDASVSRFQFLVSSGGGMVLVNRMRRACQTYIADTQETVVKWWKVFGESFADQGQSDACVVYLVLDYDDPEVLTFINKYLWPNIKDIVNDKFVPVGLVKVDNKPLWATWIPSTDKWSRVLGASTLDTHYGSAGGLMGLVFGIAFAKAVKDNPTFGKSALIPIAKQNAKNVLADLS